MCNVQIFVFLPSYLVNKDEYTACITKKCKRQAAKEQKKEHPADLKLCFFLFLFTHTHTHREREREREVHGLYNDCIADRQTLFIDYSLHLGLWLPALVCWLCAQSLRFNARHLAPLLWRSAASKRRKWPSVGSARPPPRARALLGYRPRLPLSAAVVVMDLLCWSSGAVEL